MGVTEVTIRNRYKDLIKSLGIEDQIEKISTEEDANEEDIPGFPKKRRRKKIISKFKSSQLNQNMSVEEEPKENVYADENSEE